MLHSSTINTPLVQSANLNSLISFSIRCVFMTCFSFEFHCRAFDSRQFHFGPINPSVAPTPNPNTPSLPVTTTHTHTHVAHMRQFVTAANGREATEKYCSLLKWAHAKSKKAQRRNETREKKMRILEESSCESGITVTKSVVAIIIIIIYHFRC